MHLKKSMQKDKINDFFKNRPKLKASFLKLTGKEKKVLEKVILLDEGNWIFADFEKVKNLFLELKNLASIFLQTENFYQDLGGIEGYFNTFLKLLKEHKNSRADLNAQQLDKQKTEEIQLLESAAIDIRKLNSQVKKYVQIGLKSLPFLAEVYPIGGSGDRLNLKDKNKKPLPAACLPFMGKSLLSGLIRDLQAREFLYYKTYKKKIIVPIVLMTSDAKDNHKHILNLLAKNSYFNRPKKSFFLIKQMSVPVISEEGHFVMESPMKPLLKPGGHGVIWKLMEQGKVFDWLIGQKKQNLLIRQINNPVAGLDYGLLAFIGYGVKQKKKFGFAGCPRRVFGAEGTDVLKCRILKDSDQNSLYSQVGSKSTNRNRITYKYNLSNVEYTDFTKWGLKDEPIKKGSFYSKYPANTNILFAEIKAVKEAIKKEPYPGIIINLKTKSKDIVSKKKIFSGRLELMMQNISDALFDVFKRPILKKQKTQLKTYLTYGERIKTLSSAKKAYDPQKRILETPEGAFYDYLKNMQNLFQKLGFVVPKLNSEKQYLQIGPSFLIMLHPALGPLFSEIAKKIKKGKLAKNSELVLDLAEVEIKNLQLDGSLIVEGKNLENSSVILQNVKVQNKGIYDFYTKDKDKSRLKQKSCFWKNRIFHLEKVQISLEENAQFIAKDLLFTGSFRIRVLKNQKVTAFSKQGKIFFKKEKLNKVR